MKSITAKYHSVFALLVLSVTLSHAAELTLADPFGDEMVLQQGMTIPVWGTAESGAKVTVSFANQTKTATADAGGQWKVALDALSASSANRPMKVASGAGNIEVKDVLVGEVWICSGQSNMEMGVTLATNAAAEVADAKHPTIRLRVVNKNVAATPQTKLNASPWRECTPASIAQGTWNGFSATAYYFGRSIQEEIKVPVGLIHTAWGGTLIEPWIPAEAYHAEPALKAQSAWLRAGSAISNQGQPTGLYNSMIAPWTGFPVRGAIWYQGESNCIQHDGPIYLKKMQALVSGWRQAWGRTAGNFPFYFVQIAPFRYPQCAPHELADIWEAQTRAALTIPNTGMAHTQDIGNLQNIHPLNKQEVGLRLARLALVQTYKSKTQKRATITDDRGPEFNSLTVKNDRIIVKFDHALSKLAALDGKPLTGFEIAGDDDQFAPADAQIAGDAVILTSKPVPAPVQVRFAWTDTSQPNLVNGDKLPAAAFRASSLVNLALNATYTCTNPNTHGFGGSGQLTDGSWNADKDHCFASNEDEVFPKEVLIDLKDAKELRQLKFGVPPFGSTKTVIASISADAKTFTEVGKHEFGQDKAEISVLSFTPAKARFIKLSYSDHHEKMVKYPVSFVFTTELEAR